MTTFIQYVDDIDDSAEEAYLINTDEEDTSIKRSEPIEIPKSVFDSLANKYVPYVSKNYTIKPYNGPLVKPPEQMLFATWNDHVSYAQAWDKKIKRINKKKLIQHRAG